MWFNHWEQYFNAVLAENHTLKYGKTLMKNQKKGKTCQKQGKALVQILSDVKTSQSY